MSSGVVIFCGFLIVLVMQTAPLLLRKGADRAAIALSLGVVLGFFLASFAVFLLLEPAINRLESPARMIAFAAFFGAYAVAAFGLGRWKPLRTANAKVNDLRKQADREAHQSYQPMVLKDQ